MYNNIKHNGSIVISNNGLFIFTGEMWSSAVLYRLYRSRLLCGALPYPRLRAVLVILMEWNKMAQELLQSE